MNKQISNVLKKAGVPSHLLGYEYLGEAIEIVLADRSKLHAMTKELYPSIAKKHSSLPSRVERAIRHAIKAGFYNLTHGEIKEMFGNTYDRYRNTTTNGNFTSVMVDMINYGEEAI